MATINVCQLDDEALDSLIEDCVYLAPAHRIGTRVVTADLRFANALALSGACRLHAVCGLDTNNNGMAPTVDVKVRHLWTVA